MDKESLRKMLMENPSILRDAEDALAQAEGAVAMVIDTVLDNVVKTGRRKRNVFGATDIR